MEWLEFLKRKDFFHRDETLNNVVYSNQVQKVLIERLASEFAVVWTTDFSLYIDDEHILSLPSESHLLANTIDLCDDEVEIKIELKKSKIISSTILDEHNVIVYSQANILLNNLQNLSLSALERFVFSNPNQLTFIIIYDDPNYSTAFSNNFITIGDINALSNSFNEPEKQYKIIKDRIKERNENVRWYRETSFLPPDVFYFYENNSNILSRFLNKKAASICVAFTALNTDYLDEDKLYESTYSGLKQTKFKLIVPDSSEKEQIDKIFSLYNWAYSEKTADKIGLIQNIINLHIKEEINLNLEPLLKNASEIFEMVKENYRVYIQKSVKSYLDERKQVEDFIRTTSNEISKQISGLTDIVTKNLFGLLATAITAAIGFNKPENQAYIPWVLYIYSFFSIALTIYYSTLANANKKAIIEIYNKRVTDYKKIFFEDRIDKITGNSIIMQTKIFRRYLHWTVWPSIGISLAAITFGLMLHGVISKIFSIIHQMIIFIINGIT
ncbi:hypothetical protein [Paenibacillus sp. FSL M7-0896]|uniref:hypothetical protein n=1 Tax=Paenibacillus sp. FSL M7-0896 TaxID=2921610 RepID=UPI0030DD4571